jgi:LmbE family N-acetylglucosaminyl deacetylase
VAVEEVLRSRQPDEVYVPYARDGTPDHEATYRIVVDALERVGRPARLLEYPVWFWNRWPWVPFQLRASRDTLRALRRVSEARFGLDVLLEFKSGVFVEPLLERKRLALARHRSQTTVLRPGTAWPTLASVSEGEFLECLFQQFEVFRSSECPAARAAGRGPFARP